MKKLLTGLTLAAAGLMASSFEVQATPYTFVFTGEDILYTQAVLFGTGGDTPVEAGIYDGASRVTMGSEVYTTYESGAETLEYYTNFLTPAMDEDWRMTMFNLWGLGDLSNSFGDANATGWGEEFDVGSWSFSGRVGSSGWISLLYSDSNTLGEEVPTYASLDIPSGEAYANGIDFSAPELYTFSITVDLDDSFAGWYNNEVGTLTFWLGGIFVDSNSYLKANYQTNMVLTAEGAAPVPEPSVFMLFWTGLVGLLVTQRKKIFSSSDRSITFVQ